MRAVRGGQAHAESGRPVSQVAWELGVSDHVLYCWRGEEREVESQGRSRQAVRAEHDVLARLKREHETLRKERNRVPRVEVFVNHAGL